MHAVGLDGRVVGGFVAWTPAHREIDDTDRSVLRILAGQTAAALQNSYVAKDVDTTELVWAVRAVSRGESAFDAHSASAMVRSLSGGLPDREGLTRARAGRAAAAGPRLSNRAIGGELYISETTVKFHVGNLLRKLMVSRRAEAVYAATKLGLL